MLSELLIAAVMLQDRAPEPVCKADVRWVADTTRALTSTGPARQLSVLTTVAGDRCGRAAELSITAVLLDQAGEVVCWGTVRNVSTHSQRETFLHVLEFKVGNLLEFVRWRNAGRLPRQPMPLTCHASDGVGDVTDVPDTARSLRLLATASASYEAMATDELVLAVGP